MVSTRRTAHQEPEVEMAAEPGLSSTLRKKPIRRATAKKIAPETKPKPTRSKKSAPLPASEPVCEEPDVVEQQETSVAKPSARPASRAKKDVPITSRTVREEDRPARTTRAKMTGVRSENVVRQQTTNVTNPARRTRGTATDGAPLSPKKITQVSKPQTRNVKATKVAPPLKAIPQSRAATRKRTVSDENAFVPALSPETAESEDEVVVLSNTPVKRILPQKRSPAKHVAQESEASLSSGPTTPSDSPVPRFQSMQDEHEYRSQKKPETLSDVSDDEMQDEDASADELCGPKTPMKRASPSTEARYQFSTQRTNRRAKEVTQIPTPAAATLVRDSQGGTSQAHRPLPMPDVSESEVGEGIVANDSARLCSSAELHVLASEAIDEVPTVPVACDDREVAEQTDSDGQSVCLDRAADEPSLGSSYRKPNASMLSDDTTELEAVELVQPQLSAEIEDDINETILVEDGSESLPGSPAMPATHLFDDDDDTVLIAPNEEQAEIDLASDSGDEVEASFSLSPTPETLVWENIRQDFTIPVNFDAHLAGAYTLPQGEQTERLSIAAGFAVLGSVQYGQDIFAGAEAGPVARQESAKEASLRSETVDTTVNLNDFIDMAALAEPTQAIQVPDTVAATADDEHGVSVEHAEPNTMHDQTPTEGAHQAFDGHIVQQEQIGAEALEADIPHYALSTLASRRKSLPAISIRTPIKAGTRPKTSDGASMPRTMTAFTEPWWARSRANSAVATPVRSRSSTVHELASEKKATTPAPPSVAAGGAAMTPCFSPKERYPKLGARKDYTEHASTVAAPARYRTPACTPLRRPTTAHKPPSAAETPRLSALRPRRQSGAFSSVEEAIAVSPISDASGQSTPTPIATPGERFPRLATRATYGEHAKTAAAPKRFHTPASTPIRRPATVQKPTSLRKIALQNSTPLATRTPIKTPLKPPAVTPSQAPMTPHPAAPLKGIVALVEVFTLEGASASAPFIALLHRLGAKTTKVWSERVTHVVFKDGSPTTLQRIRLNNKDVEESGKGAHIHCVNSRWITDCDAEGKRMDESDEAYFVDVAEIPRGGKRRRKSMEPAALLNVNGNVIRDRSGSLGRSSLGRSPLKFDSPAKKPEVRIEVTPRAKTNDDKENSGDDLSSPVTPAYLAAPDTLIQQTAPVNRVRKLGLKAQKRANDRRLTAWNGCA